MTDLAGPGAQAGRPAGTDRLCVQPRPKVTRIGSCWPQVVELEEHLPGDQLKKTN